MSATLQTTIVDDSVYKRTAERFREAGIRLPKISALAQPVPGGAIGSDLASVDPDAPDPRNLHRVHWHNAADRRGFTHVPGHLVLPPALTGVDARIVILLGSRFPMIRAHKVLAAYGCMVPRLVSGQFDPARHRAVWPSTGNYCRGGIAISRILGCRGVAVLPEGMSRERFAWLENWVADPSDIVRTPGTESNVKEIYDACHALAENRDNVILNQFSEYANYVIHRAVTGPALESVFDAVRGDDDVRAAAFVCASGSAGTLAAGDYLKERLGTAVCVVEALECPTLLYNGYGEHNIQGIGDKHVPLIHNVMNTDFVAAVCDAASDALNLLFNTTTGRDYLAARREIDRDTIAALDALGLSSIANLLAAIKLAKYLGLGSRDVVLTVATDGAELYTTERDRVRNERFAGTFDDVSAAEVCGRYLLGVATDHVLETTRRERERIFNLGYYTWVEQQGTLLEDFDARRDPGFWDDLMSMVAVWDDMIDAFNTA